MMMLAQEEATVSTVNSIMDFVIKGGPMMVPIAICSMVALTVLLERLLNVRRSRVIPRGFMKGLREAIAVDRAHAIAYCEKSGSPIANVLLAGLKRFHEPTETFERHIREAGEREIFKLRKYLRVLAVIASITPLMGLVGTIFGMIKAFQTVATSGEALGKAELLAEGIYEAMITTAAGLLVAIPALVFYHWLTSRIERMVFEIDRQTVDFIEDHRGPEEASLHLAERTKVS
ncbi:MAG: MotA/TolQ/ExbB proton channel family protein [Phycisphaerales bacterium]|nr:MotA/TolQ/ExbB proton channel family protein [Phycisphaerales bacterium]